MDIRKIIVYVLIIGSTTLLVAFLWWHYRLGLTRYFDVDEFAHLSWAYQMLSGRRPYVDFLFFFPPGFQVFLMPLFAFGGGVVPILMGRLVQFGIFVALVGILILLFWIMRRTPAPGGAGQGWTAVMAGVFLAFLPMPFDKFLEIRPDTLATLFAMAGMVLQIMGMKEFPYSVIPANAGIQSTKKLDPRVKPEDDNVPRWYFLIAGFFYGLSLLILPKVLPHVGVAVALEVLRCTLEQRRLALHTRCVKLVQLVIGLATPLLLFGLWALTLGDIGQVIYSLTKLPVEANKISRTFIMMPDLFFYPNATFYGAPGWSTGLLVNHAIWIIAIIVAAYRLVAPFLSVIPADAGIQSKTKDVKDWIPAFAGMTKLYSHPWSEFLIAATFFTYVMFYVQIVPLKHTQYLIPIAVFVAFYAADAVDMAWKKAKRKTITIIIFIIVITIILGSLYKTFLLVNSPKLAWTNADTVRNLTAIYQTIPTNEYVLDLTGETIYYRHPYAACCTPFGQSAPYLTRPLPSLTDALETSKTRYIFEGGVKRTTTLLPQDQAYISVHYAPHPTIDGLLVRK